jgi:leader peptidase (prepilin peptidase)/N-methyltransferase
VTWVDVEPGPWWFVGVLAVVGAGMGHLVAARLATLDYRLDDETGAGPRVAPWAVTGVVALLWAFVGWRFGSASSWTLAPAFLTLVVVAVVLAWVDADVHRLPRGMTRPAYPVLLAQLALASLASGDWTALRRAVIAAVVLWVVYFLLAVLAALLGSGFGLGDVTLAGLVGLMTGYLSVGAPVVATYAAFLLSGVYGIGRILLRRGTRKDHIAFGPWMLVGVLVSLVAQVGPLF